MTAVKPKTIATTDRPGEQGSGDRLFVTGLARGLALLAAFTADRNKMSLAELARATGLPKTTVTRLSHTLIKLGYLSVCPETRKVQPHPRVLTLGYPVLSSVDKRLVAAPLMQELADHAGGTVSLGIRDGLSIILIERSRDRRIRALPLDIGSRLPLETTAIGRAYFAAARLSEKQEILRGYEAVVPDRYDAIRTSLGEAAREYARRGYCKAAGTWEPDVNAVGTAVRLSNETLAAFNCGGPASRVPAARLDELGGRLVELAEHFQTADWVGQLPPRPYRGAA